MKIWLDFNFNRGEAYVSEVEGEAPSDKSLV